MERTPLIFKDDSQRAVSYHAFSIIDSKKPVQTGRYNSFQFPGQLFHEIPPEAGGTELDCGGEQLQHLSQMLIIK